MRGRGRQMKAYEPPPGGAYEDATTTNEALLGGVAPAAPAASLAAARAASAAGAADEGGGSVARGALAAAAFAARRAAVTALLIAPFTAISSSLVWALAAHLLDAVDTPAALRRFAAGEDVRGTCCACCGGASCGAGSVRKVRALARAALFFAFAEFVSLGIVAGVMVGSLIIAPAHSSYYSDRYDGWDDSRLSVCGKTFGGARVCLTSVDYAYDGNTELGFVQRGAVPVGTWLLFTGAATLVASAVNFFMALAALSALRAVGGPASRSCCDRAAPVGKGAEDDQGIGP